MRTYDIIDTRTGQTINTITCHSSDAYDAIQEQAEPRGYTLKEKW
jgi:hypothetical protein